MAKRKSDIRKLICAARQISRQSIAHGDVKRAQKVPGKTGWWSCKSCGRETEVIRIDHVIPIGKEPDVLEEFGTWLPKLLCGTENLQGLCNACHKIKSKEERAKGAYK